MSPNKPGTRRSGNGRTGHTRSNPRRTAVSGRTAREVPGGTGSSRKPETARRDRSVLILAVLALLLLVAVILMLNPRVTDRIFRNGRERVTTAPVPVIERIDNEQTPAQPPDPVVELGVPENVPEAGTPPPEDTDGMEIKETTVRLFFVRVNDEGNINIKSVLRPVPSTSSPLTASINALIDGPRPGELSSDVLSLIPEGSRLIGARIDGDVAFLDFNEQFRFNALGLEGYRAQVEQVVYTATEFPTVGRVQILIEGQRIDYLGGEGFWVGGPLGRDDF